MLSVRGLDYEINCFIENKKAGMPRNRTQLSKFFETSALKAVESTSYSIIPI